MSKEDLDSVAKKVVTGRDEVPCVTGQMVIDILKGGKPPLPKLDLSKLSFLPEGTGNSFDCAPGNQRAMSPEELAERSRARWNNPNLKGRVSGDHHNVIPEQKVE